jgi:hypothetical protein
VSPTVPQMMSFSQIGKSSINFPRKAPNAIYVNSGPVLADNLAHGDGPGTSQKR